MSTAPNFPGENLSTVFLREDGLPTPPPSPVLIANAGPTNGEEPSVDMTDDDVPEMSESPSYDSENFDFESLDSDSESSGSESFDFEKVARLAERLEVWHLAHRAEEAIFLELPKHTLCEVVAGFSDASLVEEPSETNSNIQRTFLDEACVRMLALVANLEFRDFLDSQPTLAVEILQRLFLGPPRRCANYENVWSAVSPDGLQHCPYCGWEFED
ncbi:hypothetical protein BDW42DRAFT_198047 [Aspergillus taichungensis]|uniref:Uncharacterized protein n=1 Tax=Aspergillus taichungensis TaxID=482145 RepID=A0A2J5HDM8_9EURO|nr:hypothetical protein BDW42DRAFT_198047 [Aspergillus taichungensis]